MQDPESELLRIHIPRRWVNKGKEKDRSVDPGSARKESRSVKAPALNCALPIPYCGLPLKVVSSLMFLFFSWALP
jgi:hypothetical protein